jgi:hypothetical protein
MYSGKHYFTVSGKHLTGTPSLIETRDLSDLYRRLEAREFARPGDKTLSESAASSSSTETPASTTAQVENTGPSLVLTTKMELLMHGQITPGSKPFIISTDHNSVEYGSQSEADQALCNLLAIEGLDADQIDEKFRESSLCREKWTHRKDYRDRTIKLALKRAPAAQDEILEKIREDQGPEPAKPAKPAETTDAPIFHGSLKRKKSSSGVMIMWRLLCRNGYGLVTYLLGT